MQTVGYTIHISSTHFFTIYFKKRKKSDQYYQKLVSKQGCAEIGLRMWVMKD